jgi:hypothetical protein
MANATKDFNRQVKNNIERFDDDFRFQLSDEEVKEVSRCKKFTLNEDKKGRGHNIKYNPYAFGPSTLSIRHLLSIIPPKCTTVS